MRRLPITDDFTFGPGPAPGSSPDGLAPGLTLVCTAPSPGSGREFHPPAPTDPDVNLSIHPARAAQSSGRGAVLPVGEQARRTFYDGG